MAIPQNPARTPSTESPAPRVGGTATWLVPEAALSGNSCRIAFVVTDEMVGRFAALTGDRSSLHVSEVFARRSAYRRPVAHGMLPVAFLALLPMLSVERARCVPVALSGRFRSPVYAGDRLSIISEPGRLATNGREVVHAFRIEQESSRATVTSGEITVAYCPVAEPVPHATGDLGAGMLLRPVELNDLRLNQIEKGMKDSIAFTVSQPAMRAFVDLLSLGIDDAARRSEVAGLSERLAVANLMSILMFSTSVGVSIPGASATFLEFTARVDQEIEVGRAFVLQGEVVHRSSGTRIVKKEMVVRAEGSDEIAMRGKISTLVNEPPRRMPTVEDLKAGEMGWGLTGKTVLVTGSSRGIGETIAKLFSVVGARVIVNYHTGSDDAGRVVREIRDAGGEASAIAADVTNADDVASLVRDAIEHYGAIDVLVNNAARDFRPIALAHLTWDDIQRDIDVIAKGAFLCCQQVIPHMLRQGGGKIINIASIAVDNPPPDQTKYVMAKSALVGLTRSLAVELAARNIQVNMVSPSFVETDLVAHIQEGFRAKIAQENPMGRHASPVEVARAVLFLASPHAAFTTGQKIMVTGGSSPFL